MHDGYPYGYLQIGSEVNHRVIPIPTLARMVGCQSDECELWVAELEEASVFSRTEGGVIYSRRLVRDEVLRAQRVKDGKMGGNPALKKTTEVKGGVKGIDKTTHKQMVADADAVEDTLISLSSLIQIWNKYAVQNNLSKAAEKTITAPTSEAGKKRRASALVRLREHPSLDEWETVIRRICARPYCRGENDSGWSADFEYLTRVDTFDAHLTGKFANVEKPRTHKTNGQSGKQNHYTGMSNSDKWEWGYSEADIRKFELHPHWKDYVKINEKAFGIYGDRGPWPSFEEWAKDQGIHIR